LHNFLDTVRARWHSKHAVLSELIMTPSTDADRFAELVRKSGYCCAMVMGKADAVRLFYPSAAGDAVQQAVAEGYRHYGLVALVNGELTMEIMQFTPREETRRMMRAASREFLSALALMARGGTVH